MNKGVESPEHFTLPQLNQELSSGRLRLSFKYKVFIRFFLEQLPRPISSTYTVLTVSICGVTQKTLRHNRKTTGWKNINIDYDCCIGQKIRVMHACY